MLLAVAALLGLGALLFIIYPLFFQPLRNYQLPVPDTEEFSQRDALLAALSELEEEQLIGRLSRTDYQQQKLVLQRQYLEVRAAEEESANVDQRVAQEASGTGSEA
ncbi:MAG TPA: hypothetical protein EYM25_06355 [Deltaproteobacteria bacterium]|nr:hypothetical protein [Deltaproteobacteria bacterium]